MATSDGMETHDEPGLQHRTPDEIDYGDFKIVSRVHERSDGSRRVWLKDSEGKILNIISK
jgi:hypothetical protein